MSLTQFISFSAQFYLIILVIYVNFRAFTEYKYLLRPDNFVRARQVSAGAARLSQGRTNFCRSWKIGIFCLSAIFSPQKSLVDRPAAYCIDQHPHQSIQDAHFLGLFNTFTGEGGAYLTTLSFISQFI